MLQSCQGVTEMRFTLLITSRRIGYSCTTVILRAEEWPKWMGPNGDNISTEAIAPSWPASGPREVWTQPVGLGYSSPLALDGKIYLFSQVDRDDTLTTFDAGSGNIVWKQAYAGTTPADAAQSKNPDNELPVVAGDSRYRRRPHLYLRRRR